MKDAQSAAGDEGGWGSDSGTRRPNRPLLPLPRTQARRSQNEGRRTGMPSQTHAQSCSGGETEARALTLPDLGR